MSKKDSFWFKHDSTSGRGLRMRKMAHIYNHWGKGIYWDVIEILRDQANYCFDCDDSSLQMLCDLIGCKDEAKFISWFRDCVKLDLLQIQENKFYSSILCENMSKWEIKKRNGSEMKANIQANRKYKIREDKIIEDKIRVHSSFVCPTIEQIKAYCLERKNQVDAERWLNHYQSNGWMVGKNKMRDWKAAVRTWEKSNFDNHKIELKQTLSNWGKK